MKNVEFVTKDGYRLLTIKHTTMREIVKLMKCCSELDACDMHIYNENDEDVTFQ